jgi:hypothetical protein
MKNNELGLPMRLGYCWWSPIHLQAIGLMQLNLVDQDQRRTTSPATTFPAEGGSQFTDRYGMEGDSSMRMPWLRVEPGPLAS